jgi:hypothetical protein
MKKEERDDFRVCYHPIERPKLTFSGDGFEVMDISRRSIKFSLGITLRGEITFEDGGYAKIEGDILRIQNNEVVIQLSKDIPAERIFKEHLTGGEIHEV